MNYQEYNNSFLGFTGKIDRKNYIINMVILVAIIVLTNMTNFNKFSQYFSSQAYTYFLLFFVGLLKFIVTVGILSVIYRRISDFSNFEKNMKKVFAIFFFIPFLYYEIGRDTLSVFPGIIPFCNLIISFLFITSCILSIIFAFLKSKNV